MEEQTSRPASATIVSAFLFAATGIATLTSISLLHPGTKLDAMWRLNPDAYAVIANHAGWQRLAGAGLLCLGAATAWMGAGLLHGRRSAWRGTMALFIINGTGDVVTVAIGPHRAKGIAGVVIVGAFLYLLTRKDVRDFVTH